MDPCRPTAQVSPNQGRTRGRSSILLRLSLCLCFFYRVHGSSLSELSEALETKNAVYKSVQSIIPAAAPVKAGMDVSAALSVKDVAGFD